MIVAQKYPTAKVSEQMNRKCPGTRFYNFQPSTLKLPAPLEQANRQNLHKVAGN